MLGSTINYFSYRRHAANAWTLARSRRHHKTGQTIEAMLHDGHRLVLRGGTQDHSVFHEIYVRDVYRIGSYKPGTGDIVDLGGNVGLFSTRVAALGRRVIVYEPIPTNFQQLLLNVGSFNNIIPVQEAVGGQHGSLALFASTSERGTGRFSAHPDSTTHDTSRSFTVPCITLDELFAHHQIERCDLLKIDVEGAEYEILDATSNSTFNRINTIAGEFHPSESSSMDRLKLKLKSHGLEIEIIPNPKTKGTGMFFARHLPR